MNNTLILKNIKNIHTNTITSINTVYQIENDETITYPDVFQEKSHFYQVLRNITSKYCINEPHLIDVYYNDNIYCLLACCYKNSDDDEVVDIHKLDQFDIIIIDTIVTKKNKTEQYNNIINNINIIMNQYNHRLNSEQINKFYEALTTHNNNPNFNKLFQKSLLESFDTYLTKNKTSTNDLIGGGFLLKPFEDYLENSNNPLLSIGVLGFIEWIDLVFSLISIFPPANIPINIISLIYTIIRGDIVGIIATLIAFIPVVGGIVASVIKFIAKLFTLIGKIFFNKSKKNIVQSPTIQQPSTVQPSTVQPSTVQPSTVQPSTVQPSTVQQSTVQPATIQSSTGQPLTGQPLTGQPSTVQPSTGQPLTGQPSTGQPSTGQPLTGQLSTGQPLTGQPLTGQPSTGQPLTGQPSTGQPLTGQPSTGQPLTGQPLTGQLSTGQPNIVQPNIVQSHTIPSNMVQFVSPTVSQNVVNSPLDSKSITNILKQTDRSVSMDYDIIQKINSKYRNFKNDIKDDMNNLTNKLSSQQLYILNPDNILPKDMIFEDNYVSQYSPNIIKYSHILGNISDRLEDRVEPMINMRDVSIYNVVRKPINIVYPLISIGKNDRMDDMAPFFRPSFDINT